MRSTLCFLASVLLIVRAIPVEQPVQKREPFGFFSSPNYPNDYGNDQRREWIIRVREGYHVKFRFTSFDLEDSYEENEGPCVYDYVLVSEGENKIIGRFCGNAEEFPWDAPRTNEWFHSKGNETRVLFVSDYSNEGISPSGFNFHYVEQDNDECEEMKYKVRHTLDDWDELIVCDHFCNNIPGSYYCSCRNGYRLHENQHTCVAVYDCIDQTFTTDDGVIESPDYPNPYAKLSHCSWDIEVRDGLTVLLRFDTDFGVEEHDDEGCVYDVLKVNDQTYCGTTAPSNGSVIDMATRNVRITFDTDLSVEQQGFRIVYNTSRIRCSTLSNPQHGSIASGRRDEHYEFENVVTFGCDTGYRLEGAQRLECRSDGTWSAPQPRCQIKSCGRPDNIIAVSNSHIIDFPLKRFTYGESITVECDDWYEMTAGITTWRCNENKQWVSVSELIARNPPSNYPKCRPICGKKNTRRRRGVAEETLEHEFPWLVFLNFGEGTPSVVSDGTGKCTGNIISSRYVLTAAHCLHIDGDKDTHKSTHVWISIHDRDIDEHMEYAAAEKITLHPQYKIASTYDYDVGLIKLDRVITMGNRKRPICLPSTQNVFNLIRPDARGVVSGWSLFSNVERSSKVLLKGNFPVVNSAQCWTSFQTLSAKNNWRISSRDKLTDNMFCAGYEEDHFSSTCNGDSGGPFMMEQNGIVYASGLVSWGLQQACEGAADDRVISYTVYARLTKPIVDWIKAETNGLQ